MKIIVEKNVPATMSDGTVLMADVYRPDGEGRHDVILQRLPYGKDLPAIVNVALDPLRAAGRGYAVVVQDTRGRNASEGAFEPYDHERSDGEDTIAWAVDQEWSTGRVGMVGPSYVGAVQWAAAAAKAPGLVAIAPLVTATDFYHGWTYQGGAFRLGFVQYWATAHLGFGELFRRLLSGEASYADLGAGIAMIDSIEDEFAKTPLVGQSALEGFAPYYRDWVSHRTYDSYWQSTSVTESVSAIDLPTLSIGGWFDLFSRGTLAGYVAMRENHASGAAPQPRLVMGPWSHGNMTGEYPDVMFGTMASAAVVDVTALHLDWFDTVLPEDAMAGEVELPVKLFIMGSNAWREEADWPLPDTLWTPYYLGAGEPGAGGGGTLVATPDTDGVDSYQYDPRDPAPTVGGTMMVAGFLHSQNDGPHDQRAVETRGDVLCFTTPPLEQDLEVVGPVSATLHVSSTALDTDFTVKLVDVAPDGLALNLCDGILRARYRDSLTEQQLLEPGVTYEVTVDVGATANVFKAGHSVRVEISSSSFPQFDRNTNTGGAIFDESIDDSVVATNSIFHGPLCPSSITLPVIAR